MWVDENDLSSFSPSVQSSRRKKDNKKNTNSVDAETGEMLHIDINANIESVYEDIFDKILQMDGISQATVINSLKVELNNDQVFQAGEGAGASGSFFFFSYDQKFLIKTLKESEVKLLDNIINEYLEHLMKNPDSLLARIYGLFTIKT